MRDEKLKQAATLVIVENGSDSDGMPFEGWLFIGFIAFIACLNIVGLYQAYRAQSDQFTNRLTPPIFSELDKNRMTDPNED